nr:MAG TPA: hypothetical protein [Caudoviricetes sp.]
MDEKKTKSCEKLKSYEERTTKAKKSYLCASVY